MLPKLNWFRLGKPKDESLGNLEPTEPKYATSGAHQTCYIKDLEDNLKTKRKNYNLAYSVALCGLLFSFTSICVVYYFSFVSPNQRKIEVFTGLISPVFMLIVLLNGFLRATMQEVSSNYSLLLCRMKYLPRGPQNPELTKQLNQMKNCMRELSNWQNLKDLIFIILHFLVYIGLIAWEIHIAYTRDFLAVDGFLNVLFIGMIAYPIGISLMLPVENWFSLYKAKQLSERYVVHSII